MQFEMYVCDGELGEIFEYLFGLFHKYLMFVQCAQTHVVLSIEGGRGGLFNFCTNGSESNWQQRQTDLDGSPSGDAHAPRPIPEGDAPADRNKAGRLERFYAIHDAPYHLLGIGRRRRFGVYGLVRRPVIVYFGHGCLERA